MKKDSYSARLKGRFTRESQLKYTETTPVEALKYLEEVENNSEGENIPFIEGLADYLMVDRNTLYSWFDEYPIMKRIYEYIINKQKLRLLQGSLSGKTNVIGAIFQLKANHGLKDQPDKDKDTNIIVNNISYKDEDDQLKQLTNDSLKTLSNNTITDESGDVDNNKNEDR